VDESKRGAPATDDGARGADVAGSKRGAPADSGNTGTTITTSKANVRVN
jgi:hypothetical protein